MKYVTGNQPTNDEIAAFIDDTGLDEFTPEASPGQCMRIYLDVNPPTRCPNILPVGSSPTRLYCSERCKIATKRQFRLARQRNGGSETLSEPYVHPYRKLGFKAMRELQAERTERLAGSRDPANIDGRGGR